MKKDFVNKFNEQNILIVGGAGFVGANLARLILDSSPQSNIHVIDNLLSSEAINIPSDTRTTFTQGSISDDAVIEKVDDSYDYIFHLATYHGNQSSIHDPLADHENNTLTTLKLFERVKRFKRLKSLVYSSAGCSVAEKTFDAPTASKEVDLVSLSMDSPYSISKIIGEFYAKYYFKQHGLPVIRARFQNVYGPWEILGAGQWRGTPATVWRNVTPTFIYKALNKFPLPLENDGIATRDFIFVEDIARGLLHCALFGTKGDVYNLASGKQISIRELAETINCLTNNSEQFEILPKRAWDNSGKRFGCPQKSKEELGFEAQIDLQSGLETTIAWTKENFQLIESTIEKHKENLVQA